MPNGSKFHASEVASSSEGEDFNMFLVFLWISLYFNMFLVFSQDPMGIIHFGH